VLIDPAYAVNDLLAVIAADDMQLTGVLATHYHPDHVGGSMMGYSIEGVAALLEQVDCPIHVQSAEAPWVQRATGLGADHLTLHESGDVVMVGEVAITLVHTPGHTPGSQCFHVGGCLVSGDTLFLDGCGRTDLPGSNPEEMYHSIRKLATVPDDTVLFPGHRYSAASSDTMVNVRDSNFVFAPKTPAAWLQMFGR
jgi:glyoxylase-like metal-dependent hydrolase (beta-lactamase superfamily II)